jgi:hypothetical protein
VRAFLPYWSGTKSACFLQSIILSSAQLYQISPRSLTNGHDFQEKVAEQKMCTWFPLQLLLSETFLLLRRIQQDAIIHAKYQLFLLDCNQTRIISTDFSRNSKISNNMKNISSGHRAVSCRRTDRHKKANSLQLLKTNKCTNMCCVYSKTRIKTLKKLLHVSIYRPSSGSTLCTMH